MEIILGKTQVSLLNPPNEGVVIDGNRRCKIGRNGYGMIVLRCNGEVHPEFFNGMDMQSFCQWINDKFGNS